MDCFVIVGAGQAGCSAAFELRRNGFPGRIVLVGEESHFPYERPPLSKGGIATSVGTSPLLHAPEEFVAQGIELLRGVSASSLDLRSRRLTLSDGSALPFDKLLLATGGRARQLMIPGGQHGLSLRTLDDARRVADRLCEPGDLVVVGAGIIGLEIAATARELGWRVKILEVAEHPLARLVPMEVAAAVAAIHTETQVQMYFGVHVEAIESSGLKFHVYTTQGRFNADLVVAGIGMQPEIRLAEAAAIAVGEGVLVNEYGETSAPGVYAAGDAAELLHPRFGRVRIESWQHAANHAKAVSRSMSGVPTVYDEVPWAWSDQYEHNLQIVGFPQLGTQTVWRGSPALHRFTSLHLSAGKLVGACLMNQGRDMRPCRRLIESNQTVDLAKLGDSAVPLRELAGM